MAALEALITAAAENWFWSVFGAIIIFWIFGGTIDSIWKRSARERSRREIAAYIASGSMTPEQGERLLNAGEDEE